MNSHAIIPTVINPTRPCEPKVDTIPAILLITFAPKNGTVLPNKIPHTIDSVRRPTDTFVIPTIQSPTLDVQFRFVLLVN